jgi:hypothetical protein
MISAQQNAGHLPTAKLRRPGVLRTIQQTFVLLAETLISRRIFITEHSGQQPRYRIDYDRSGQLTTAEHEIADGQLIVGKMPGHPLIHSLIAATEQQQIIQTGELTRQRLAETRSLRRKQDDFLPPTTLRQNGFHCFEHWLRLEQHPLAAAKRPIINRTMTIVCPVSQIVYMNFQQVAEICARNDSVLERRGEEFGENRDDVEAHVAVFRPLEVQKPFRQIDADDTGSQIHLTDGVDEGDEQFARAFHEL